MTPFIDKGHREGTIEVSPEQSLRRSVAVCQVSTVGIGIPSSIRNMYKGMDLCNIFES